MACHRVAAAVFVIWLLIPCGLPQGSSFKGGGAKHVIMYVGNGYVVHAEGVIFNEIKKEELSTVEARYTNYGYTIGYGRVKAASGDKFNIGDIVRVTTNLNVRTGPGTSYPEITDPDYPGYAPAGTIGTVLSGPSSADSFIWWEIDYGPGLYSGWSVEGGLEKVDDNILPTVDAFSVTPASVTLGDTFTIPYTVSDTGGSGLKQVELWRKGTGVWEQIGDPISLVDEGDGPYSNSFYDAPTSIGTYEYGIHVEDNAGNLGLEPDPPGPIEVTVTATPSIDLSPSSYGFGNRQVGQCSPEYSFTLTNTGGGTATGSVSLTGTHASQFTITQGSGSFSLGTGASKTIKVKFCPTSTGTKSATLFADGSNCNDDSSSLSGTGTLPPSIDLSPSGYGFGDRQVGQCSPEYSFTLTNTGGGTATGSVSLTGTHATQFTITQGSGSFSLGTGASKTIKVKFCPTSTGTKSATLFADGTNCNDDSSSLSGTGTQAPSIDLSPSSYGFGDRQVGQCSPEYSFTLTNTGGGTATGSVSLTGTHATQFTITQGSGSFSLGTGASKTIKVKFCPTSTGTKSATLFADGSNCNDDSSSLSGTGTLPPSIDLSPSSYGFGNRQVGQCSPEYSFTLTNTGGGTATGSVSLTGTHATQFTITQGSGSFSLGTGASKTIKVKFCPTSTGAKSATLFADGSNCNDDSSSLSGTGTQAPSLDLFPSSYGFGNRQVGQCSPEYSFTLTNTGGGTATGSVSLTGTHATQFTITQGSGSFSLGTGASKTIKVKFCPTSTGAKTATLFADGSNCNDDSSSLSGTGVENPETVVSIEEASAPQGGTVTVPIKIVGVENICGASIWLNYNKDVVIVDSVSDGDLVPLTHSIDNPAGVTKINWDTTSGMTGDFVFAYVTLKAVGNAGDTCLLDLDVKELYDCDLVEIPRTVVDGTFEVIAPLMEGDVTNLNVCVSLKDSTLIKFYLVDMATLTPDQLECADTNDDGEVTLKDSTAIKFWLVDQYPLWESPADDHMMEPVPCSSMSLARAASAIELIEGASVPAKSSLLFVADSEPIEKKKACSCYPQKEMIGGQEKLGGNIK